MNETLPIISANPAVQARYEQLRAEGQSHSIADMLAHRQFAGVRTSDTFMSKFKSDQFSEENCSRNGQIGDQYRQQAKAAGVSTQGKVYHSGIARFPGDPEAWIGSKGDLVSFARRHNATITETVSDRVLHAGHHTEVKDEGPYTPAPDIIEAEVQRIEAESPEPIKPRKRRELVEATTERLSGR